MLDFNNQLYKTNIKHDLKIKDATAKKSINLFSKKINFINMRI